MSRGITGFLLPVVFGVLAYFQPTFGQRPPPGYQLLTAPQVSGGVLLTQRQAVPSAVQLLRHGFRKVAPFFDRGPEALGAYAETSDEYAEAGEIWRQTTQARQRSIERSHADWTKPSAARGSSEIPTLVHRQTSISVMRATSCVSSMKGSQVGTGRCLCGSCYTDRVSA